MAAGAEEEDVGVGGWRPELKKKKRAGNRS